MRYRGKRVGIMAMDPGRTTGLLVATIKLEGSAGEVFQNGSWKAYEIPCLDPNLPQQDVERPGAREIATLWRRVSAAWRGYGITQERHAFIYEDFNLRGQVGSLDRAGVAPIRVTSLVQGMLDENPIRWFPQQPSEAKTRWTNERLRNSGLWIVGSEHKRDAMRHAALWVVKNL